MIRLSVDTSFEHLGLCLTRNGVPLANYYSLCNRRNSKIIFEVIDDLLKNADIKLAEVDAYVVNRGPGSYTGVRIGMAVVKTFAQVHKKPVVAVNSLELLAGQIRYLKNEFPVLLNCTRLEVFHATFRIVEGKPVAKTPIQLSSFEKFYETKQDVPVVLYRISPERRKPEPLFEKLKLLPLDHPVPDALLLDRLGAKKMLSSSFDQDAPVHPLYIKREVE
ncbi:MAG TPA: tRNA (adenosine(37)-N6)-threonylcarbamoyltransferase complex dimerization subunit type 1 TsaB [Candidatus Lambdaproteobacteria bacterium]|nr:tRNA (adenosine(37)-N6)-threonylcarbamoyltransferase complex dimerization subunit type 1 TsaB [SAR324 cluster bacterium]HBL55268.1 tRNA (adenosine(37)-N6)-threonylcarbamoyltransferase complex dimerization subunit type 1 TsaB [Deltaproteobacteria bacterium]HIA57444.1 tRNA (adenosine(37)-N6)-threonylcarbamoyltransferase complex dimerization subunit type 1 TsaB [Candidatus Lambdaproteobacteria bacterium]HIB44922.1 tRNA (adenosine(37)-N6)-threonylcarbamoyltransferase complex dimerization subunit 